MEMERERERRIWEDNVQYQEELEKQLRDQEKARQEQYEEFLKEKLMIDEIVRKIYAEDQRYALYCTSLKVELHNGICPIYRACSYDIRAYSIMQYNLTRHSAQ